MVSGPISREYRIVNDGEVVHQETLEIDWASVRSQRRYWLERTDLWMLADRYEGLEEEHKDSLLAFRDDLRTLPQRFDDPNEAADAFPLLHDYFMAR